MCISTTAARRFHMVCLECGSPHTTRVTEQATVRSAGTHRAEIIRCPCGLEMLLSVDLTRIKPQPKARGPRKTPA